MQDSTVRDEVDIAARKALEEAEELILHTKVQINVSFSNLGVQGNYCVVGYIREDDDIWQAIGFTETSDGRTSFTFIKTMTTDYNFESPQRLRFELIRLPNADDVIANRVRELKPNLTNKSEMVDAVECLLAEVVSSPGSKLSLPVEFGGSITIFIEEIKEIQNLIKFNVRIDSVASSIIKKHKPKGIYFVINRSLDDGTKPGVENEELPIAVRSEVVVNYEWFGMSTSVNALCRAEMDRDIIVQVYAVTAKQDIKIATATITYRQLETCAKGNHPLLVKLTPPPRGTIPVPDLGGIQFHNITIDRKESFLDYVSNGMEISLYIGVDFTKSNKDPNMAGSLHYLDPLLESPSNDYLRAITAVVDILQHYDSDKKMPVYGFGARLPPSYTHCSHCFACTGDFFNPEVEGVDGVLDAYRNALKSVVLHGPTNFSQIINLVSQFAQPYSEPKPGQKPRYFILLIITDGVITDMKSTITEIVKASDLPISVIIVGVGDEDFGLMDLLDADEKKLYSPELKRNASRDIVQFVPFNEFKDKSIHALAVETLDEIPREVVSYFRSRGITPRTRETENPGDLISFSQQVNLLKKQFIKDAMENTNIPEKDILRVIDEEKIASNDITYLSEVAKKGEPGHNAFETARPVVFDTAAASGDLAHKYKMTVREVVNSQVFHPPSRSASIVVPHKSGTSPSHDQRICKSCSDRTIDSSFVPCGHSIVCSGCAKNIGKVCPVCHQPVISFTKTSHQSME